MFDPMPVTGGFFDDLAGAARGAFRTVKGAASSVASFVHHPPGWLAAAFPLMTSENQRYWAGKLGGSTGTKIYDSAVRAVASKYLGPQGPQLLEAYDKVMEDASHGDVDAKQILARAPQIAHLAAAGRQGPEALRAAAIATKSAPHVGAEWQPSPHGDTVSGTMDASQVGHWFLPLALGVPAGALGGYYYRGWRDRHPGEILPGVPSVSGSPWAHLVGADSSRRAPADWPRWQALIASATRDVLDADRGPSGGAAVYLWSLEPTGEVVVVPLASHEEGMARWRDRIQADHAALALFDRHAHGHWPNPVLWTRRGDLAHEGAITAQIARPVPDYMVGSLPWQSLVSGEPWQSIIDNYVGVDPFPQPKPALRSRGSRVAQYGNEHSNAQYLGVELQSPGHDVSHAFPSLDAASDWLATASGPASYRAIYDATDPTWPAPISEVYSAGLTHVGYGPWYTIVGAATDSVRRAAAVLAQEVRGRVVVVVRYAAGNWGYAGFESNAPAIEHFARLSARPESFAYVGLFDKSHAHFPDPVDEEVGEGRPGPIGQQPTTIRNLHREVA